MRKSSGRLLKLFIVICISHSISWSQTSTHNTLYRISKVIDTFWRADNDWDIQTHTFTYDKQGQPVSDTWDYIHNGKPGSSNKLYYTFDANTGRLLSRISTSNRYLYSYDNNGNLQRMTLEIIRPNKTFLCEDTRIERHELQNGKTMLLVTLNKLRVKGPRKDSMDVYFNIEYTIDKDNNISDQRINIYDYNRIGIPFVYKVSYDNHPNPLQQIALERWYDWGLDNSGSNNLVNKKMSNGRSGLREYEYNELGLPVRCVITKVHRRMYEYELIQVPQQVIEKSVQEVVPAKDGSSMILYPNPARTEVNVSADNIGNGLAVVRVYDISGKIYKEVTYNVNNKLEALILLEGMSKGTYIVEINSVKTKISRKLILQ